MAPAALTPLYHVYRALTSLGAPLARRAARKRFAARQGPVERFQERTGHATLPRPDGRLIWLHAVSVGEFLSVLDLVRDITDRGQHVLVTTTTSSAADLAAQRLPKGVIHQFSPLDTPAAVKRFLDHWQPDLVVFVESEIWPNQIVMAKQRGIPVALINARLSDKSLKKWNRSPRTALALLTRFDCILTQTPETRSALIALGAPQERVSVTGDMKAAAAALPFDQAEADSLAATLSGRPVWVASSTHQGEETPVSDAHKSVIAAKPDALLILVPRHPERGNAVEALLLDQGWTVARRSRGEAVTSDTQIYLADTLGETGLWYVLSPIVFVGGSFVDVGGHNPYEPAHFNCAILHGPLFANFDHAYRTLKAAGACLEVQNTKALGQCVTDLMKTGRQNQLSRHAHEVIGAAANNRAKVTETLLSLMN